jgi:hypothetical protein
VALAQTADFVIVVVSNAEDEGGEGNDRSSIALASDQTKLATAVFTAIRGASGVQSTMMMINGGVRLGHFRLSCFQMTCDAPITCTHALAFNPIGHGV